MLAASYLFVRKHLRKITSVVDVATASRFTKHVKIDRVHHNVYIICIYIYTYLYRLYCTCRSMYHSSVSQHDSPIHSYIEIGNLQGRREWKKHTNKHFLVHHKLLHIPSISQAFGLDSGTSRAPRGQSAGHRRGTKEPQGWDDPHEHEGARNGEDEFAPE